MIQSIPMEWKQIPGFDYVVSDNGAVKSLFQKRNARHNRDGMMSLQERCGYLYALLWNGEKQIPMRVHRLVAAVFIGDCKNKVVHHSDGNKKNNKVENLIIMRKKNHDAMRPSLKGSDHGMSKLKESDVLRIKNGEFLGMSLREIGQIFNVTKYTISDILREKTWRHICPSKN